MELIREIIKKYERSADSLTGQFTGNSSFRIQEELFKRIPREQVVSEAQKLEEAGLCRIRWVNGYRGYDIEKLEFPKENLRKFYHLSGLTPKNERIENCLAEGERCLSLVHADWIKQYLQDVLNKAGQGKGKFFEDESYRKDILACMLQLDCLTEPVFHRVFSRMVFQDSKRFENDYEEEIIRLARKYHGDVIDSEMSDKQVLEQLYIDDYSQELMLKGNLSILLQEEDTEHWQDLAGFTYGVTLNAQTMKQVKQICADKVRRVMTIENKANYLTEIVQEDTLILFCHGFFSPLERQFLERLKEKLSPDVTFFHSGDMDYGGIRIFQYIREHIFPALQPYHMDVAILRQHELAGRTETLEKDKKEKLQELRKREQEQKDPCLLDLISYMLEHEVQMEQEELLVI